MNFPTKDRGRKEPRGIILSEERQMWLKVENWFMDNNVPRTTEQEIKSAHPDIIDQWEYVQTLCRHCHNETVNQKGRRMCLECNSMDC